MQSALLWTLALLVPTDAILGALCAAPMLALAVTAMEGHDD